MERAKAEADYNEWSKTLGHTSDSHAGFGRRWRNPSEQGCPVCAKRRASEADRDGDGKINEDELRDIMKKIRRWLTDDEVNDMFSKADPDNKKKITYDDVVKIIIAPYAIRLTSL